MYKTKNGWTKQKMIDHVKANFKGQAYDDDAGQCLYLTPDGRKCAVGLFIPDGHKAQKSTDGANNLTYRFPDLANVMPLDDNALNLFQHEHDLYVNTWDSLEDQTKILTDWIENNVTDDDEE